MFDPAGHSRSRCLNLRLPDQAAQLHFRGAASFLSAAAAFLRLFKQFPGSSSEAQLRGLTWSSFSTFLFPLPVSAEANGSRAPRVPPLPGWSPRLSGPDLFPTMTWPDLAGGSPQLHGDLAAARPHPAWHTGLQEALPEQKMTQNLRKNFCPRKATLLLGLRYPQLKSSSCASRLHPQLREGLSRAEGRHTRPQDLNCSFPNPDHQPGQGTALGEGSWCLTTAPAGQGCPRALPPPHHGTSSRFNSSNTKSIPSMQQPVFLFQTPANTHLSTLEKPQTQDIKQL